ncbi:MAG: CGGC domain-containing protein [Desulfobacteraceae bacterium]|jgi:predicted metal-binding protein
MAKIGLIRCEKNENRCPLTGCLHCLENRTQGFATHETTQLVGLFTCHCPGNEIVNMAKVLKSKGADAIHFCTCIFSGKENGKWVIGQGFCDNIDNLIQRVVSETGITCIKGSAHLPEGYQPKIF